MSEPTNFPADLKARASPRLYNAVSKRCSGGRPIGPEHVRQIVAVTAKEWGIVRGFGDSMVEQLADIMEDWELEMGTVPESPALLSESLETVTPDERQQLILRARDECEAQLDIIRDRRNELIKGGFDPQLASAMGTIGKTITQLNTEARQQEKHEAAVIENLSDDQQDEVVKDFIENISKIRRREIIAFASELDVGTGLLGH